jgi:hypothetical protein
MAIHNDPRLYTGGSERFNMMPHVQLYAQLAARKQARDDAFDEYMRNMNKNINSAGLRNVDREAFDNGLADFQKFGIENKDAIRSRKGGADMIYQQKYQDLQNLIAESKGEEQKLKPFVEMRLDPNKWERVDQDGVMKDIDAHNQPLRIKNPDGTFQRNPTRKSLDYNSFSFNPKHYTPEQWMKYDEAESKAIPRDKNNISLLPHPQDKFSMVESTSSAYTPEKLQTLGEYNRNRFAEDGELAYSFKTSHPYEKWVKDNGKEYDKLNQAYKAVYGQDANIQDEDDLFVATRLQKALQPTVSEKVVDNWGARDAQNFAQQKELKALEHAYNKGEASFRETLKNTSEANANLWIGGHVKNLIARAGGENGAQEFNINGQKFTEKRLPNDIVLRNSFKNGNVIPDYITVTKEGKLRPVYLNSLEKAPNGGYKYDAIISQPADVESVKLGLGKMSGVKHLNEEMSGGSSAAPPTETKTTTIKFKSSYKTPKGNASIEELRKSYSDQEIEDFIKKGLLK